MKTRDKNPILKEQIGKLHSLGREKPIWDVLASELNRPTRARRKVNLIRLEKNCKAKEIIVVPGSVLGEGEITKALSVFALKFSKQAEDKIKKSGGSCFGINDLLEQQPKKLRIIG